MFDWIWSTSGWAALVTLTVMEVVLGIDNVVFISVLISRLPEREAKPARAVGLALAFGFRVVFLFTLTWLMRMTVPVVTVYDMGLSWRDLILLAGGVFLIWKATKELHHAIEQPSEADAVRAAAPMALTAAIAQVALIDLVFSVDSIVTAIGMAKELSIMVLAVVISMSIMYAASGQVARFIRVHPTTKILALAFLILIGVSLAAEGWHFDIPRGYIYSAMGFAALVEAMNVWAQRRRESR
jgi:predicted tellurium resistance membrane protein TerC